MPIINREMDNTERRIPFYETYGSSGFPIGTGYTYIVAPIPMNGLLSSVYCAVTGISGTPSYSFNIYRFTAGATAAGFTSIPVTGVTLTPAAYGTSGMAYIGPSFGVGSATFAPLGITVLAGDLFVTLSGGANSAALNLSLGGVVQCTDDYVKYLGT